jgi:diguanylate cyclase (GGDEF)-like protein
VLNSTKRHIDAVQKVQEDFAARSQLGALAQPLCWTLVLLTTHFRERAPVVIWTAFALLIALSGLRFFLVRNRSCMSAEHPRCRAIHTAVIVGSFAIWGLVPAWSIQAFGYHSEDTLVLLFYHAAMSFAMVNLLIHDIKLMKLCAAFLFVPVLVAQLVFGGPDRWAPLAAFAFYLSFLLSQGGRLHSAFLQQISDNEELALLAHHDHLTGLPNRLSMNLALDRAIREARQSGTQVALLYIDLDGFKLINDSLSHRVGDLFLTEVAARLTTRLRQNAFIARLGGDEFGALLTGASGRAAAIAAGILEMAHEPLSIEGHTLEYSASIGISFFPDDADDPDHLMRAADHAMYQAKTHGKDQVCFFDSSTVAVSWSRAARV